MPLLKPLCQTQFIKLLEQAVLKKQTKKTNKKTKLESVRYWKNFSYSVQERAPELANGEESFMTTGDRLYNYIGVSDP